LQSKQYTTWKHKHLIDVDDLSIQEWSLIFKIANKYENALKHKKSIPPLLKNSNIFNIFFEPSTRTRASFELAAKLLGANVINITSELSSVQKGESLEDTIKTVSAMYSDIIILRHEDSGAATFASTHTNKSIINAGDGSHAHPTQALTDAYTIQKKFKSLKNLNVTMVGDIEHSRVARSDIWLFTKLGAKITLCGPTSLIPKSFRNPSNNKLPHVDVQTNLKKALTGADVIIALRMQTERQKKKSIPTLIEYAKRYQVTKTSLQVAKKNCLLMHPGPKNEGVEISREVANGPLSKIKDQVANGVVVRMAILQLMYMKSGK
jgi:aspartate carbamoyltransferase catalytic subunit